MNYDPYAPNVEEQLSPEELAAKKEADRKRKFARDWPIEMRKILGGEALKTEYGPYYVRCGRDLGRGYRCFHRMGHSAECSPGFANAWNPAAFHPMHPGIVGCQRQRKIPVIEIQKMIYCFGKVLRVKAWYRCITHTSYKSLINFFIDKKTEACLV